MSNPELYDKKVKCLYCQEMFLTQRVKVSKIRVTAKDTDFCTYFSGENPLFYDVNLCPYCGCAFTDGFSPISLSRKEQFEEQYVKKVAVFRLSGSRTIEDALKSYKLALFSANLLGEKRLVVANICMRLAWFNRYLHNKEEERRFLSHAVHLYEELYELERLDQVPMEEEKLIYLIGEINGRLGYFDKTRKWFSYIFTSRQLQARWRTIARERWLEFRRQELEIKENPDGFDE